MNPPLPTLGKTFTLGPITLICYTYRTAPKPTKSLWLHLGWCCRGLSLLVHLSRGCRGVIL